MSQEKKAAIRNSTVEFLIFTGQAEKDSIEVRVAEETVWLTQKLMGVLYDVTVPTISEHLSNLFSQNEVSKTATIRNFRIVQKEGGREISRSVEFFSLEAIIAVGFRVKNASLHLHLMRDIQNFLDVSFFLPNDRKMSHLPCFPRLFHATL
ncbi:MAG: hypothetical protein HW387_563 [Parachlamydiales bacterium]|nr:hypothetical protein [Parachlamydiales bacterium]